MVIWTTLLLVICCPRLALAFRIGRISNARFDSGDVTSQITTLQNIPSVNSCICQCHSQSNCSLVVYHGVNQSCSLFAAELSHGSLQWTSVHELSTVVLLKDVNSTGVATTDTSTSLPPTTTSGSCVSSTTPVLNYSTSPTSYQMQTYNYTATFTGIATLEFGFMAKNPAKTWHLDDVSIIDRNAFDVEQLTNGGFENLAATGWQTACSSQNCVGNLSGVVAVSCHSGSFCYEGTCPMNYDYLRQSFGVIINHVYTLRFWIYTDGHAEQAAYVSIG